ncbi:MAG TPA: MFS transporter [Gemmata sp.]
MHVGTDSGGPSKAAPGAGWALALLIGINLFNYIDRQILSATLPKIQLDATIFHPDDEWIPAKLGALTTAFMVAYMCLSPVFGRLGDTMSRWVLIGGAVIFWSLATGGTGLAAGYLVLFLTRCLVGVGEAAYGPVAPAMLSDLYPVDHRGRVMAWFYVAIPVGSALGFVIGSQVAETSLGWRGAFYLALVPGLVLGALCFVMKEPARTAAPGPAAHGPSYWDVLKELRLNKSFVLCCAGMTASTFVLGGVASVMQLYVFDREARFTLDDAAIVRIEKLTTSDGRRVVPEPITEKLKAVSGSRVMTLAEFKAHLRGTLTEDEQKYNSWVYDSSPADGSLTNGKIGLFLGATVVVGGLVATLLGGTTGDYFRNRGVKGAYFRVSGWGMIIAFPFFFAMLYAPFPLAWGFLFVAVFGLFFNTGPANTIVANVTRSPIRATAFAINILVIHALGDAISPLILGVVAKLSDWHTAFVGVSFLIPLSGALWLWGARHLDEDTAKAEAAVTAPEPPAAPAT